MLHTPRTTGDLDFHAHSLGWRQIHIGDLENKVRDMTPLIAPTPASTSFNWWPYPPWGQSTLLPTSSGTATPVATVAVSLSLPAAAAAAVTSSDAPTSTPSLSATTSSPTPRATSMSNPAPPPINTSPSNPGVHTATNSHFNMLYLVPVFVVVGLALAALAGCLGYRWYSRRLARKGGINNGIRSRGRAGSVFVPGPAYIPMNDDPESARLVSPTTAGSPSKYTRHGAPRAARSLMSAVAGSSSRRSTTRSSSIPPSQVSSTRTATPSHSRHMSEIPTGARSRASTISPVSLSDDDNVPYETIRHTSIRRGILERLQRGIERSVSRAPSRRTTQTYLSAPSAYSGTHTEESRPPSTIGRSSSPPPGDTNTDWIPGSGFRIVEEAITSPPPSTAAVDSPTSASVAGLPGQPTSAWDDGAAIRQAVDAHPGERWLAWTRSWTSSPPASMQDRFTAVPARRRTAAPEQRDVVAALPRSPPQLTSGTLHETLTFSPSTASLAVPRAATTTTAGRRARGHSRTPHAARQPVVRVDSGASSIVLSEGHGTPAMRYAARKTALSRVEDILAHSYSSRDLALASPGGPDAMGVRAPSMVSTALASTEEQEEGVAFAAGIVQRLAAAEATATATNHHRQK